MHCQHWIGTTIQFHLKLQETRMKLSSIILKWKWTFIDLDRRKQIFSTQQLDFYITPMTTDMDELNLPDIISQFAEKRSMDSVGSKLP